MSQPNITAEKLAAEHEGVFWTGEDWCDHMCTSNCRREGCNCGCGEYHGNSEVEAETKDYIESLKNKKPVQGAPDEVDPDAAYMQKIDADKDKIELQ